MKKHAEKTKPCISRILLAGLLALLLPLSQGQALSQQANTQQKAEVMLLLLVNEATAQNGQYLPEGTRLIGAHIVAFNAGAPVPISVLSLPTHTRVVLIDGGAKYATLAEAFAGGGEAGVGRVVESIRYLLNGAQVEGAVVVTPNAIAGVVDAAGGIIIPLANIPSSASLIGKNTRFYPLRTDNDPLAMSIKTMMNLQNATADYDIDSGKALRSMSPEQLTGGGGETVRLTGAMAAQLAVHDNASAAYLYMSTQRSVFYALLRRFYENPQLLWGDLEGCAAYGVDRGFWQRMTDCAPFIEKGSSLKGEETTVNYERHFLPDSISLGDWILSCIYDISR